MRDIDQDLYRKIIEQGLAEILTRLPEDIGYCPGIQKAVIGEELSDAMVKALKAYTEANN